MANQRRTKVPNTDEPVEEASPRSRAESRAERLARREELRRQQKAASFRRKWGLSIVLGLLALLALGAFLITTVIPRAQALEGVERYSGLSQEHVPGEPTYDLIPPVGGPHSGQWYRCGVYDQPVPSHFAVHSMEHGAVWITYRPDLPADQVEALRKRAEDQTYVLVSPFPGLPAPVVASAWNHQVLLDGEDDERLDQFVRYFRLGADAPERGSACTGGVGTPS